MNSIDSAVGGLIAAQQASLDSAISAKLAAKVKETNEQQGDAVLQLLDKAVQFSRDPNKGNRVDSHA